MRKLIFLLILSFLACNTKTGALSELEIYKQKETINQLLDNWHKAAAEANDSVYFGSMAENSIYIGTDASELWTKSGFYNFAKKYFAQGKAWDFKPIERNIYFSDNQHIAWFDEKLDTWMGVCRASGVLQHKNEEWKIVHYHLSVAIPNEKMRKVIEIIKLDTINK